MPLQAQLYQLNDQSAKSEFPSIWRVVVDQFESSWKNRESRKW